MFPHTSSRLVCLPSAIVPFRFGKSRHGSVLLVEQTASYKPMTSLLFDVRTNCNLVMIRTQFHKVLRIVLTKTTATGLFMSRISAAHQLSLFGDLL